MSWKDSGDCIVYPDGSLVKGPKALCELQGYVYAAWIRTAEVFDALDKSDRAQKLRAKAERLFERFNSAFWDDELGFYALALDGDKNKVLTVASNAGHCLLSGIVPAERAKKVKERLMASDMWTGWGIRTLSASHPAFNPYNYQTGSVWPHDNAIIALGFKRYGFDAEAAQIAHDISKAASYFQLNQLPELYTAFRRDETMRRRFQCNISVRTYHRRGRPALHSCSHRLCWDSCPTRRTTSFMSTPGFRSGCPI
jgi:glycogen debranching enzyme